MRCAMSAAGGVQGRAGESLSGGEPDAAEGGGSWRGGAESRPAAGGPSTTMGFPSWRHYLALPCCPSTAHHTVLP